MGNPKVRDKYDFPLIISTFELNDRSFEYDSLQSTFRPTAVFFSPFETSMATQPYLATESLKYNGHLVMFANLILQRNSMGNSKYENELIKIMLIPLSMQ